MLNSSKGIEILKSWIKGTPIYYKSSPFRTRMKLIALQWQLCVIRFALLYLASQVSRQILYPVACFSTGVEKQSQHICSGALEKEL